MKSKKYIVLSLLLCFAVLAIGQVSKVTFLNTGKMNIAMGSSPTAVSLYVPNAVKMSGSGVDVTLNGIMAIGGSFYHDATNNVFALAAAATDELPTTSSTGTLMFKDDNTSGRQITSNSIASFDRSLRYMAIPNIVISSNDSIVLPGRMGIDARSIRQTGGKLGYLLLKSEKESAKNFDASLRITGSGTSSMLVDAGSVVVEREMSLYRGLATPVFAFASPFDNTQLSGYFAGNWVRTPEIDPVTGHARFVLANRPQSSGSSVIDRSQYVTHAQSKLQAASPYFIQPQATGFNYATLQAEGGLVTTGAVASAYDKGKFVFNGKVYNITPYGEQLFADDLLYSKNIATPVSTTINWVIGNSYTSPLSIKLIAKKMEASPLTFAPHIYIFPAGSTSYQAIDISGSGAGITLSPNFREVPAMSIFMVRVSKANTATGTFSIGKSEQVHSTVSHSVVYSPSSSPATNRDGVSNQVIFRLAPTDNDNIYDLAAVGFRDNASSAIDEYDAHKIYGADFAFQLYTLSTTGAKLSINGIPTTTEQVVMGVRPALLDNVYTLKAMYAETLSSEGLWLEDRNTDAIIDLKTAGEYSFESRRGDREDRFIVHFVPPTVMTTDVENMEEAAVVALFHNGAIRLMNLPEECAGASLQLFDMSGRIVIEGSIKNFPSFELPCQHLPEGVYIVRVAGKNRVMHFKLLNRNVRT